MFSMFQMKLCIFVENVREVTSPPLQCTAPRPWQCHVSLEWSHFYLEHMDKVVSAGFLHCKVAVFPFVINNKHLGRETLRLYKCPVCPHFCPLILVSMNESCLQQLLLLH